MGKDLVLFLFVATLVALVYRDCRRVATAEETDQGFWADKIHVEAPLTAEQMEELDDLAAMEDMDPEHIAAGIEWASCHATWLQKPDDEIERLRDEWMAA